MGVEFTSSADEHDVPHEDAMYAVAHYTATAKIPGRDGYPDATVFVGHPHGQADRFVEVIVEIRPPRTIVVFHAMQLSDKFRWMLPEEADADDQ